ncbi:unnamed protein product [Closterium sp. NIES-53]
MERPFRRNRERACFREPRLQAVPLISAVGNHAHGATASPWPQLRVPSSPATGVTAAASSQTAAAASSTRPTRGSPLTRLRLRLGSSWAPLVLLLLLSAAPPVALAEKEGQGKSTQKIVSGPDDVAVPTLCFNDIQVATDGFSDDAIVGGAGHTTVYRGEGPSGEPWAVKRAKRVTVSGSHLFRNEVDFLSQIKHPNIVPLLYSCDDNSEQILVFEYLANGPLSVWLRPPPGDERAALTFEQRVDAALGVGEAVQYLHSFSRPTIIHRDIKSDTILLDDHLKVKLGGLGLLKHLPGEGMRLRVARKKGYLDPEYFQTFKVTPRCDVYSFGVVMLEMLTALPPIVQGLPRSSPTAADASFAGEAPSPTPPMSLPQWALPLIQEDRVEELVDPRMPPGYPRDSLVAFARIAAECVAPLRKDRPDMPRVTFLLAELKRPAALRSVAFARFYTGDHKAVPISHTS